MTNDHPYIIVHMTRALSYVSVTKNSLAEALSLNDDLNKDEEVIHVVIMEWSNVLDRYTPFRNMRQHH